MNVDKRWLAYLAKAAGVLVLLYAVSLVAPSMPVWALGLVWAAFSLLPAIGVAYHAVIKKTYRQQQFLEGSRLGRFNAGRIVCLIVAFAVSAACMASILVACPKWDAPMWAVLALSVPAYWGVSLLVGRILRREYAPLLQESYIALASAAIVGVVLCVLYGLAIYLLPAASYSCAAEAFVATPKPFENSPSILMSEFGSLTALVDGMTAYALAKAAETSLGGYLVWRLVLGGSAFFGFAALLAVCSIRLPELKRVFSELENAGNKGADRPMQTRYLVCAAVLPIMLTIGFVAADANAATVASTHEYTMAQNIIRGQVNLAVYLFDGKYYDEQAVNELLSNAHETSENLSNEAREKLVPLINASFDARVANVDSYLDWYYRLFGDLEQLTQLIQGKAEDFAKEQFTSHIEEGIDDSELNAALDDYLKRAEALKADTLAELEQYEITEAYPEWLVTRVDAADALDKQLMQSLEPTQKFLNANERLGISAAAGVASGIIAKKLIQRVVKKAFFKAILERIGVLAGSVTVGSSGGPAGVAVSVVVGVGTDVALQKVDELANRESYKQEILETIEEQRQAMLAAIGVA